MSKSRNKYSIPCNFMMPQILVLFNLCTKIDNVLTMLSTYSTVKLLIKLQCIEEGCLFPTNFGANILITTYLNSCKSFLQDTDLQKSVPLLLKS